MTTVHHDPAQMLSRSHRRIRAAVTITQGTEDRVPIEQAVVVADQIDAAAGAALRGIGLDDDAAREVLDILWGDPGAEGRRGLFVVTDATR
jgi:hypothetical protein